MSIAHPSYRYARKDRRPLDPPPVVQLKLYDVSNSGTAFETHTEFDSYEYVASLLPGNADLINSCSERGFGLLCHIDLFPVPMQDDNTASTSASASGSNQPNQMPRSRPSTSTPHSTSASPTPSAPSPSYPYPHNQSTTPSSYPLSSLGSNRSGYNQPPQQSTSGNSYALPPLHGGVTLPPISSLDPAPPSLFNSMHLPPMQAPDYSRSSLKLPPLTPMVRSQQSNLSPYSYPPPAPPGHVPHIQHQPPPQNTVSTEGKAVRAPQGAPDGVVAYLNGHPIKEEDKCTESLVGARFCQASSLEWQGRKALMFVFAVRVLHFWCLLPFDTSSRSSYD